MSDLTHRQIITSENRGAGEKMHFFWRSLEGLDNLSRELFCLAGLNIVPRYDQLLGNRRRRKVSV